MLFFPKGDPGLVSWNHIDDEVLLQWLDDAAGLLSNNIHNDESAHQSGTSFNTSAIIRTPSHSTNSLRDARWSSNNGLTTSKVLPGPPQDAEYANLDEPSIAFGGDSVPVDEKPNSSKRRYNAEELEKVNSVRASSACTRCQVMKEAVSHSITWKCALLTKSPQCSEDSTPGPCRRCQAIELSSRIWKTPCFRGQLTAAELFRTGKCVASLITSTGNAHATVSLNFPFGSNKITQWHGKDRRQVDLFYPLSNAKDHAYVPHLTVKCRRFRPGFGDVVTKSYPTPQGPRILDLPPFSLIDLPAIRNTMAQFVAHNLETFVNELKVGAVGKYFSATFDEIMRLSKSVRIICIPIVMKLLMISRATCY
jgi:hypothetical protein